MLILLSSAKTLDFESALPAAAAQTAADWTQPALLSDADTLVRCLQPLNAAALGEQLEISEQLATLNAARYKAFRFGGAIPGPQGRPAIYAYKGDSYLDIGTEQFTADDLRYAHAHLRMLSGLYGVLRALDLMQPYRLEMGTALRVALREDADFPNLYRFWGDRITQTLNDSLDALDTPLVVNLASNEYFKAIDEEEIEGLVVKPVFKDWKDGSYKVAALYAKRARGAMAGYMIRERVQNLDALCAFSWEGYTFNDALSTDEQPVFTRGGP
jgi:cytoplasmic iron level regulating protein YaaA (DUF328/UPF0246 family)